MEFFQKFLDNIGWGIAGIMGALVSLPFHDDIKSVKARIWFVCTGALCAYFLTDLVSLYFKIDRGLAGSVGFLMGAFGGSLLAAVIRAIKAADIWQFLKNRFGGGNV